MIGQILNALVALPKILGYVESFASAVTLWFVNRQKGATLVMIADAASMAARADSDEARFKAADAWQAALSRPRTTPQ